MGNIRDERELYGLDLFNNRLCITSGNRISKRIESSETTLKVVLEHIEGTTPNIGYRIYRGTKDTPLYEIFIENASFGIPIDVELIGDYTSITVFTPSKETSKNEYHLTVKDTKQKGLIGQVEVIEEQISKLNERIQNLDDSDTTSIEVGSPSFVGDIMPVSFRNKLQGGIDDILVVFMGDSVTGLTQYCEPTDDVHYPPTMRHRNWITRLWENVNHNKQICDRLDSVRNGDSVFSQSGFTFITGGIDANSRYNLPAWASEQSIEAETFQSNNLNAYISFQFDCSSYKKGSIVFSMSAVDGADTTIEVAEGDGKILASLDRETWVEANMLNVSQNCNPEGYEESVARNTHGVTYHQRHRRIWLKVVDGVTDILTITYRRAATDTDTSHYMYVWGIEKWNGQGIFFDNLGRGGRPFDVLMKNSSDISDRNPDLFVLEMPLANETGRDGYEIDNIKRFYNSGLCRVDQNYSFVKKLDSYNKAPMLLIMPHGRSAYYNGNELKYYAASGATVDMFSYTKYKLVYSYLRQRFTELELLDKVGMLNLLDILNNEGAKYKYTIEEWCASSTDEKPTITYDGIHLNDLGSKFWVKYLQLLFQ